MFQSVIPREKFVFDIAYKRGALAGSHLGSRFDVSENVKQLSVRTSSAKRSRVSEPGYFTVRFCKEKKKGFSASRHSL